MSRSTTEQEQYERLRKYLTPAINGRNVDIILRALAKSVAVPLVNLLESIHDQFYLITASGDYLDQKMSEYGISRPPSIGLSDELFRELGISVINQKQIRSLILEILSVVFGAEATAATSNSGAYSTYLLRDGDTLILSFDGQAPITVVFTTGQFTNIAAATAQEVADAIVKGLREQGTTGFAYLSNDGTGDLVILQSDTLGPSSQVEVLGGRAQNSLRFSSIINTSPSVGTGWSVDPVVDGGAKYTWVSGAFPDLSRVRVGDYVNIYDPVFDSTVASGSNNTNQGTFTIKEIQPSDTAGDAYFVVTNFLSEKIDLTTSPVSAVQTSVDSVLFYKSVKKTIVSKFRFASVYQSQANLLEIIIPATSQIIRRDRVGAMYLNDQADVAEDELGPYIYDQSQNFTLLAPNGSLELTANSSTGQILFVSSTEDFPDTEGFVMLDFGTVQQEGPVPYLNIPSDSSILLSPAYILQKNHAVGSNVSLALKQNVIPRTDGFDYQGYVTTTAAGRIFAIELIEKIVAAGLNIVVTVVYPGTKGLKDSSKFWVWGETGVDE